MRRIPYIFECVCVLLSLCLGCLDCIESPSVPAAPIRVPVRGVGQGRVPPGLGTRILPFLPGHSDPQDENVEFEVGPYPMNLTQAHTWCSNRGMVLPILHGHEVSDIDWEAVLDPSVWKIWMGVKLDDKRSVSSSGSYEEPHCGIYKKYGHREQVSCFDKYTTMCIKPKEPNEQDCGPEMQFSTISCVPNLMDFCVALDTSSSVKRTWFQAKQECSKVRANVLPDDVYQRRDIMTCLMNQTNPPHPVWLDVSDVTWISLEDKRPVDNYFWAPDAPSDAIWPCVKLVVSPPPSSSPPPSAQHWDSQNSDEEEQTDPGWYDERCDTKLHFVCVTENPKKKAPGKGVDSSKKPGKPKPDDKKGIVGPTNNPNQEEQDKKVEEPSTWPATGQPAEKISNVEQILFISIPIATILIIIAIVASACYIHWSKREREQAQRENTANALSNPGYVHYDSINYNTIYQSLDESRMTPIVNMTPYTYLQGHGQIEGHTQLDREDSDYYSEITHDSVSREPSQRTLPENEDQENHSNRGDHDDESDDKTQKEDDHEEQHYKSPRPMPDYLEVLPDLLPHPAAQASSSLPGHSDALEQDAPSGEIMIENDLYHRKNSVN